MQTVRELAEALEHIKAYPCPTCMPEQPKELCPLHIAHTVLARAEPELRSQCCGALPHKSTDVVAPTTSCPIGVCAKCLEHTVFKRAEPEERYYCKANECGPECPCREVGYQEGLEAQRS